MPRLFSYGSLQQPAVQLATFGRVLMGIPDALPGFEAGTAQRDDRLLANVIRSPRAGSRVAGTAFEITDSELDAADAYEQHDAYTRIRATLSSGAEAWLFVDSASLT